MVNWEEDIIFETKRISGFLALVVTHPRSPCLIQIIFLELKQQHPQTPLQKLSAPVNEGDSWGMVKGLAEISETEDMFIICLCTMGIPCIQDVKIFLNIRLCRYIPPMRSTGTLSILRKGSCFWIGYMTVI